MNIWREGVSGRSASILMAVTAVGVLGGILLALLYLVPSIALAEEAVWNMSVPETTKPAANTTTVAPQTDTKEETEKKKQQALTAECKPGQVHTVSEKFETKETKNEAGETVSKQVGKTSNKVITCYSEKGAKVDGAFKDFPDECQVAKRDKCVVRYCPVGACNPNGACITVKCEASAGNACLRKNLDTSLNGAKNVSDGSSCAAKIGDLRVPSEGQGKTEVQVPDGKGTGTSGDWESLRKKLDSKTLTVADTVTSIGINQSEKDLIKETMGSWDPRIACANADVYGDITGNGKGSYFGYMYNGKCTSGTDLNRRLEQLSDERTKLDASFEQQMQQLAKDQGSITGSTGGSKPTDTYCDPFTQSCSGGTTLKTCPPGYTLLYNSTCKKECELNNTCVSADPAPPAPPYTPSEPPPPGYPPSGGVGSGSNINGLVNAATKSGLFYQAGYLLGSLFKNENSNSTAQTANIACAKNADQYRNQIQQYNQMVQQYNSRMQQTQYQCQQSQYGGYNPYGGNQYYSQGYGGAGYAAPGYGYTAYSAPVGYAGAPSYGTCNPYSLANVPKPPQPPQPCYDNANPAMCQASPPRPSGQCNGTWKPLTASGNGCVSGWQCIPAAGGGQNSPVAAQISCQPQVVDAGMTIAISFGCQNATGSQGEGFDTRGQLSGVATTSAPTIEGNSNTKRFGVTCGGPLGVASASCNVQIAKPSAVLVADPSSVHSGQSTLLGWISSGMQSCVLSNPDLPAFTEANADNTSVNGAVHSPALATTTTFYLTCVSVSGASEVEQNTVRVI